MFGPIPYWFADSNVRIVANTTSTSSTAARRSPTGTRPATGNTAPGSPFTVARRPPDCNHTGFTAGTDTGTDVVVVDPSTDVDGASVDSGTVDGGTDTVTPTVSTTTVGTGGVVDEVEEPSSDGGSAAVVVDDVEPLGIVVVELSGALDELAGSVVGLSGAVVVDVSGGAAVPGPANAPAPAIAAATAARNRRGVIELAPLVR